MNEAGLHGFRLAARAVQAAALLAALAGLAGCSSLSGLNPVDWWHNLEGGPIADARPPPPNADQPYPSLGNIPDKPSVLDPAARSRIASALVADRANAQYDASVAPLPPAAPVPAAPKPPAPAPSGDATSSASLAAASAPPPKRAPVAPVQQAALPPLEAPAPPTPATPAATPSAPEAPAPAAELPGMPDQPPPPPNLPGVPQATAPTPPRPTPPPPTPPTRIPVAGAPAAIAFGRGSPLLPTGAYAALKSLAQRRGDGGIAIVGFGEASGSDPTAQQAAIPLALNRARAIATYLESLGVPASALRIDAEAAGEGGVARLIR